ncbi:MAG TPA: metalloregulator ArsR/SmtB family transcription factor [Beutenbergiaceae bacterium]|nr:metalloregulator ArsR/SmtB family transcription factor [Beutenbergiaceae bacterium]
MTDSRGKGAVGPGGPGVCGSGDAATCGSGDDRADDDLVFKALASPARRRMLDGLKESVHTTGSLCALLPELDRTTVLQHLRVLERAHLVTGRKVGRERHLSLAPMPIKRIHDRWISGYMQAAVDLLDELGAD